MIRHENYGLSADVYSYGIICWELASLMQPFKGLTPIQAAFAVARKGLRPQISAGTPGEMASLIRRCWASNPNSRPTFVEILRTLPLVRMEVDSTSTASHY